MAFGAQALDGPFSAAQITPADIADFAAETVNLNRDDAEDYREQVRRLRDKLDKYACDHPDYGLIKTLLSGSLAKGTSLKTLNDIDVAFYLTADKAPTAEPALLNWLAARLREAYPQMKPDQIKPNNHSVCIKYAVSGLSVDVVPAREQISAVVGIALVLHEDRAGVNALIRGVDDLATGNLPAMVVMCTNRLDALDPAVRRRAAVTFTFTRPNEAQRLAFLKPVLEELNFSAQQIHALVTATGATHGRAYGYTYSDLAQRLLPGLLLAAYPSSAITYELAKRVVEQHPPTPPFQESENVGS